ncbi:hypothetical protein CDES_11080 [Corynebacterium deserti GIMN1.010]|uniref:Aspartate aminotransferase family protein n=1 Tax=Corynebacterium deserti GIMN1.010 TaxID=931089 RepID=A0A0M3Q9Z2_9CORY|nr:aspartate aminotransferase family protein [Corynebacterium deserti]ALC06589.1 hypothetical protein CDES_11080 [Corynebacterium deserti GIMN1.010]
MALTGYTTTNGEFIEFGSAEARAEAARISKLDRAHVFYSWSAQDKINPQAFAAVEGSTLYDYEGNAFLDMGSQLVSANLGHNHPALVEAIQHQASRITNLNPAFANDIRTEVAAQLIKMVRGDFSHVFFTNGGADAIEHSIRMARLHTGRAKILSAYRSYHGATGSAMMLTGENRRLGNPTTDGDIYHFWAPFEYRSSFFSENQEEECERALQHLRDVIAFEGPSMIAAIVLEPVVGSSGIIVPPAGYLSGVRDICDEHGILFIADEVMVGFGRTGTLFAYEHADETFQPDLITFAKGVNSGYAPLGGVIMTKAIRDTFAETPYTGGLTYSGHPLAVAPAKAALDLYKDGSIFDRVAQLGAKVIQPRLEALRESNRTVGDVRGLGFFWAVEFVSDPDAKTPMDADTMTKGARVLRAQGVWPMVSGNRFHIAPPLITSDEELEKLLAAVEEAAKTIEAEA